MRTTLLIDDDLYRRVKAKAAMEGRKVTELVEDGLRAVLGLSAAGSVPRRRLSLPIVPAPTGREPLFAGMTQDEIHQRLDALQSGPERDRVAPSP